MGIGVAENDAPDQLTLGCGRIEPSPWLGAAFLFTGMHIITTLPRYSDGEINRALVKEIQTGFQLERETERARVQQAAAESEAYRGHKTVQGLGKCVGVIPSREFFRLTTKYGRDEVHSKDFMRYFQKKFPHLSPNRI